MSEKPQNADFRDGMRLSRRQLLAVTAGAALAPKTLFGQENPMTPGAFVYTEVAISVPFDQAPWPAINETIKQQPGFLNKTWLHGHSTGTVGGIYAFDTVENARAFVTGYFPTEPRAFGVAHTTRVFDAAIVRDASLDLGAVHFGAEPSANPGAFVYTELQISKPFDGYDWKTRNKALKQTKGMLNKLWLSGVNTHTLGGFDAFDTMDNALDFAINQFPQVAAGAGVALYTRVFDATVTEQASRAMNSPYYS